MWLGFLPVGMVEYQETYYQQIGSRKSAKKWDHDFVQKMIRATHGLWMERNNLLHLRAANDIGWPNNIALQTALLQQNSLGHEVYEEDNFYRMLDNRLEKISPSCVP